MESNISASRQAKRFLDERVRTDWAYPTPPPTWSASDEEVRDAQAFRERYYGESESDDSATEHDGASPYKFDSPDSIGDAVTQTREARKRRRRERLQREMDENEGLRIWVERRDQWTGAASVRKYGTKRCRALSQAEVSNAEVASCESQSTEKAGPATEEVAAAPAAPAEEEEALAEAAEMTEDLVDLVPVARRLLATNAIRASITPRTYPDIFQKIVVSSRTPSVPINLADMTKALVQGWKDADEWPPRAGVLDPLVGKKRSISGAAASALNGSHGGFMERHPHLEKSMDSVKRILHLNGHHHGLEHAERGKGRLKSRFCCPPKVDQAS